MPIQRCSVNGKPGYKFGKSGKCYTGKNAKAKARRQERAIRASGWTENENGERVAISDKPPSKVSPLKADPSRTFSLRRMFMAEFRRRFARLQREITRLVVTEDAFGIDPRRDPLTNESSIVTNDQRWKFRTNAEQLRLFEEWLKTEIQGEILQSQVDAYWEKYIEESYKKGLGRSFEEVNKGKKVGREKNLDFYKGSKSQFIQDSFHQPASIEKVKLLAGRVYTDLQGVTETMAAEIKRTLVDGMIQGRHPRVIAKQMNERVDKIGITRANTIARTEVMRAHAEGQLDAFEKMGVAQLGVSVEWSTAIANVCPLCAPLEGIVVSIKESRGMLPRHPNCRCVWLPAGVGETSKKQIKSKGEIDKAIDTSLRQEIPKKEKGKRSLREQSALSKWGGARKKIAEDRPKSLLETIREGKAKGKDKPKPSKPSPKPPRKAAKTPPKGKATPKPIPAPNPPRVPPKPVERPPVPTPKNITLSKKPTEFTEKVWKVLNELPGGKLEKEHQAVKVGEMVRKEVLNRPRIARPLKEIKELESRINELEKQSGELYVKYANAKSAEKRAEITGQRIKVDAEKSRLRIQLAEDKRALLRRISVEAREVLGEVRDYGTRNAAEFLKETNAVITLGVEDTVKDGVEYALARLPDSWVDDIAANMKTQAENPIFTVTERGYHHNRGYRTTVAVSDAKNQVVGPFSASSTNEMNSTMLHELTHAAESTSHLPGERKALGKIEREFLERRAAASAGEKAKVTQIYPHQPELAKEKGYKDEFIEHYMGKVYEGRDSFEVMTMGVEHAFRAEKANKASYMEKLWLGDKEADTDYLNFVLGVLAGH